MRSGSERRVCGRWLRLRKSLERVEDSRGEHFCLQRTDGPAAQEFFPRDAGPAREDGGDHQPAVPGGHVGANAAAVRLRGEQSVEVAAQAPRGFERRAAIVGNVGQVRERVGGRKGYVAASVELRQEEHIFGYGEADGEPAYLFKNLLSDGHRTDVKRTGTVGRDFVVVLDCLPV